MYRRESNRSIGSRINTHTAARWHARGVRVRVRVGVRVRERVNEMTDPWTMQG